MRREAFREVAKPKSVKPTKMFVNEFLALPRIRNDRNLSEIRLQAYHKAIELGVFRSLEWAQCYCVEEDVTYRINGNTTGTLLSMINLSILPEFFYITLHFFEADHIEGVVRVHSTFDQRIQMRGASDINKSFAGLSEELSTFPMRLIDVLVSGISYAIWRDGTFKKGQVEKAEQLLEYTDFCLFVREMIVNEAGKPVDRSFLSRVPVIAFMFHSWERDREAAVEFWTLVRDRSGSSPHQSHRMLAEYLMSGSAKTHGLKSGYRGTNTSAVFKEYYGACLSAWNSWRKSRNATPKTLGYSPQVKLPDLA